MDTTTFWNSTVAELKQGYKTEGNIFTCLFCDMAFEQGCIYPVDGALYDAKKAVETHVESFHSDIFETYLGFGRVYTGLSDGQAELAELFYAGHSDKEIVEITGANSISTIRNQRFAIREKYKQAKILVALVELMEEKKKQQKHDKSEKLVDFHPNATQIDERFAITQQEKDEVLNRYFDKNGKIIIAEFPAKEKKKIIILQKIMENFHPGINYSEKKVNETLQQFYEDFVTVRRYLIQYGFMGRDKTGERYWVLT